MKDVEIVGQHVLKYLLSDLNSTNASFSRWIVNYLRWQL